jgi:hypothetical protein
VAAGSGAADAAAGVSTLAGSGAGALAGSWLANGFLYSRSGVMISTAVGL